MWTLIIGVGLGCVILHPQHETLNRYKMEPYVSTVWNAPGKYLFFCRVPINFVLGFTTRTYRKAGSGSFR